MEIWQQEHDCCPDEPKQRRHRILQKNRSDLYSAETANSADEGDTSHARFPSDSLRNLRFNLSPSHGDLQQYHPHHKSFGRSRCQTGTHDINVWDLQGFAEGEKANLLDESSLYVSVIGMPGTSDLAFTGCDAWFDMMETFLYFGFCQDGVTGSGNEGIEPTSTSQ